MLLPHFFDAAELVAGFHWASPSTTPDKSTY